MNTSCASCREHSKTQLAIMKGFEGEELEVNVEELETKIMPESTAGFLE